MIVDIGKQIAERFKKPIRFTFKKMVHFMAYICCSEDIRVAHVVSLHNSVENRAIKQHICSGSTGGQHMHHEEL